MRPFSQWPLPAGVKKCILAAYRVAWNAGAFCGRMYTRAYIRVCRVKPHKVVLDNFFGKNYGDNPKYIADELLARGLGWDIVWLAADEKMPLPSGVRAVRYGSEKAMREMASAKFVVVNTRNVKRPAKKKKQIYLQTWHGGLGFKAVEGAAPNLNPNYVKAAMLDGRDCDGIISSCGLQSEEFQTYFWLNKSTQILQTGLPRNDKLFDPEEVSRRAAAVRESLGIDGHKKIILYMPTFRDDHSTDGYKLDHQAVIAAFERRFGGKFVMLIRLHPNVQDQDSLIECSSNVINVTRYADAQELYMAADHLITDYSSSAFDFALLDRPVILYALDYTKYCKDRGLNEIFQRCPFPKALSNEELLRCIETFSEPEYRAGMEEFRKFWQPFDRGDAARRVVDWMMEKVK